MNKESAIHLIEQKGNCHGPISIFCKACPCFKEDSHSVSHCCAITDTRKLSQSTQNIYEYVINEFIKEYGRDELLEILL